MQSLAQPPEVRESDRLFQHIGGLNAAIDSAIRMLEGGIHPARVAADLRDGKAFAASLRTDALTMTPCRSCGRLLRESEAKLAERHGCCALCGPGPEERGL
jgi:hypothetical protein